MLDKSTNIDRKRFRGSMKILKKASTTLNTMKTTKKIKQFNRSSQDLQQFLELNMLEDPDLVDYKARKGGELFTLHRGFSKADFIKKGKFKQELMEVTTSHQRLDTPDLGSKKLKEIVGELYSAEMDIETSEESVDYQVNNLSEFYCHLENLFAENDNWSK